MPQIKCRVEAAFVDFGGIAMVMMLVAVVGCNLERVDGVG
jgi:hypothetical protein